MKQNCLVTHESISQEDSFGEIQACKAITG